MRRWKNLFVGLLLAGLAGSLVWADSINQISGTAALDQSSPRVWRHGTAVPSSTGQITSSASQYTPLVKGVLYGCDPTCASLEPILQLDPSTDGVLTSNNSLFVISALLGFNGTTLDRIRAGLGDGNTATGLLSTEPMLFNGSNFDRARTVQGTADASAIGIASSGGMVFNGTTWDRQRSAHADGLANNLGTTASAQMGFTGTTWNRQYTASSTFHGLTTTGSYIQPVIPWSQWSVTNTPAANTQATASRAAGAAGVLNVATTVTACFSGTVSAAPVQVNLRDGASGAGTILRSWLLGIEAVNAAHCVNLSGMAMAGTAATAMTLEFAAAGGASTNQTVTLTGYSTLATNN